MRILIRNPGNSRYLDPSECWVESFLDALEFDNPVAALEFCKSRGLTTAQIVLKFDDEIYDVALSLTVAGELETSQIRRLSRKQTAPDEPRAGRLHRP